MDLPDGLSLIQLTESGERRVQEIYQAAPAYFIRVDGCAAQAGFAARDMRERPAKCGPDYRKMNLLFLKNRQPIAFADMHVHHPVKGFAYIGLLILKEDQQRQGWGRQCLHLIEDFCSREHGISTLRLGISDQNDVASFWESAGFRPNGRRYTWKRGTGFTESQVVEMDKVILQDVPVEKVLAYVVRDGSVGKELLVFRHPQTGLVEVVRGTREDEEDLEVAVRRELYEESGVEDIHRVRWLGRRYRRVQGAPNRTGAWQTQLHHAFLIEASTPLPDTWTHTVTGGGLDGALTFSFFWTSLTEAAGALVTEETALFLDLI